MSILNIILTIFLVAIFFYVFYLISELEDLREHLEITAKRFDTLYEKNVGLCDKLEALEKKASEDVYCLDITEDKIYEHFKEIHEVIKGKGDNALPKFTPFDGDATIVNYRDPGKMEDDLK